MSKRYLTMHFQRLLVVSLAKGVEDVLKEALIRVIVCAVLGSVSGSFIHIVLVFTAKPPTTTPSALIAILCE
jgi:hypothetical protein